MHTVFYNLPEHFAQVKLNSKFVLFVTNGTFYLKREVRHYNWFPMDNFEFRKIHNKNLVSMVCCVMLIYKIGQNAKLLQYTKPYLVSTTIWKTKIDS